MSTVEGLSTPLVEVPASPVQSSVVHTPILEDSDQIPHTPHSIDPDRYFRDSVLSNYAKLWP